jgi:FAD/FMN-containing dehydrogenase
MAYPEIYPPDEGYHPTAASRTMFIDSLDEEDAKTIFENLRAGTAMMSAVQVRVLGGAMGRVPADATAFAHRHRKMMVNVAALFTNPGEFDKHDAWVSKLAGLLQKGEVGAYVNFIGDEGAERVRDAYPAATWERLRKVKAQYDPQNLFHMNQNIPPAN